MVVSFVYRLFIFQDRVVKIQNFMINHLKSLRLVKLIIPRNEVFKIKNLDKQPGLNDNQEYRESRKLYHQEIEKVQSWANIVSSYK
jgi:hypothetical protein